MDLTSDGRQINSQQPSGGQINSQQPPGGQIISQQPSGGQNTSLIPQGIQQQSTLIPQGIQQQQQTFQPPANTGNTWQAYQQLYAQNQQQQRYQQQQQQIPSQDVMIQNQHQIINDPGYQAYVQLNNLPPFSPRVIQTYQQARFPGSYVNVTQGSQQSQQSIRHNQMQTLPRPRSRQSLRDSDYHPSQTNPNYHQEYPSLSGGLTQENITRLNLVNPPVNTNLLEKRKKRSTNTPIPFDQIKKVKQDNPENQYANNIWSFYDDTKTIQGIPLGMLDYRFYPDRETFDLFRLDTQQTRSEEDYKRLAQVASFRVNPNIGLDQEQNNHQELQRRDLQQPTGPVSNLSIDSFSGLCQYTKPLTATLHDFAHEVPLNGYWKRLISAAKRTYDKSARGVIDALFVNKRFSMVQYDGTPFPPFILKTTPYELANKKQQDDPQEQGSGIVNPLPKSVGKSREYGWNPLGYRLLKNNLEIYVAQIYVYYQSINYLLNHRRIVDLSNISNDPDEDKMDRYIECQTQSVLKKHYADGTYPDIMFSIQVPVGTPVVPPQQQQQSGQGIVTQQQPPTTQIKQSNRFEILEEDDSDEESSPSTSSEGSQEMQTDTGDLDPQVLDTIIEDAMATDEKEQPIVPAQKQPIVPDQKPSIVPDQKQPAVPDLVTKTYTIDEIIALLDLEGNSGIDTIVRFDINHMLNLPNFRAYDERYINHFLTLGVQTFMNDNRLASFDTATPQIYGFFLELIESGSSLLEDASAIMHIRALQPVMITSDQIKKHRRIFDTAVVYAMAALRHNILRNYLVFRGQAYDPPKIDVLESRAYPLLDTTKDVLTEYRREMKAFKKENRDLFQSIAKFLTETVPSPEQFLSKELLSQISAEIGIAGCRGRETTRATHLWIPESSAKLKEDQRIQGLIDSLIHAKPDRIPEFVARPLGSVPLAHDGYIHSAFQIQGQDSKIHPCFDIFDRNDPGINSPWKFQCRLPNYGEPTQFSHVAVIPNRRYRYSVNAEKMQILRQARNASLRRSTVALSRPVIDDHAIADHGYVQHNTEPYPTTHHFVVLPGEYSQSVYVDEVIRFIRINGYTQITFHMIIDLCYNKIALPNPTCAQMYNFGVSDAFGKPNIPNQPLVQYCTTAEQNYLRVVQSTCAKSGASLGTWDFICPNPKVCEQVYRNLIYSSTATPLRFFKIEVHPRQNNTRIQVPYMIQRIPPAFYEGLQHKFTEAAGHLVFMLMECRQNPERYFEQTTPCLWFVGSLTVKQSLYGITLEEIFHLPRFLLRYYTSKINSKTFMYDAENNQLYDPHSIKQHFDDLEIAASPVTKTLPIPENAGSYIHYCHSLGSTMADSYAHYQYLDKLKHSLEPLVQDKYFPILRESLTVRSSTTTVDYKECLINQLKRNALVKINEMKTLGYYFEVNQQYTFDLSNVQFMTLPHPIVIDLFKNLFPTGISHGYTHFQFPQVFQVGPEQISKPNQKEYSYFYTSISDAKIRDFRDHIYPALRNQSYDYRVTGGLEEAITIDPAVINQSQPEFRKLFSGIIPKLYAQQAQNTLEGFIANGHRRENFDTDLQPFASTHIYNIVDLVHDLQIRSIPDSIGNVIAEAGHSVWMNKTFGDLAKRADQALFNFAKQQYAFDPEVVISRYLTPTVIQQLDRVLNLNIRPNQIPPQQQTQQSSQAYQNITQNPQPQPLPSNRPGTEIDMRSESSFRSQNTQRSNRPRSQPTTTRRNIIIPEGYPKILPVGQRPVFHRNRNPWTGLPVTNQTHLNKVILNTNNSFTVMLNMSQPAYHFTVTRPHCLLPRFVPDEIRDQYANDNTRRRCHGKYRDIVEGLGFVVLPDIRSVPLNDPRRNLHIGDDILLAYPRQAPQQWPNLIMQQPTQLQSANDAQHTIRGAEF